MLSLGIDRATEPQHIPPFPPLELKARLCVPVRYNEVLLGYLWLIEERPLTAEEIAAASAVAEAAGLVLYKTDVAFERRQAAVDALVRDLFAERAASRNSALAEIREEGLLRDFKQVRVMRVRVLPAAQSETQDPEKVETAILQMCRRLLGSYPEGSAIVQARRRQLTLLVTGGAATRVQSIRDAAVWVVDHLSEATGIRCVAGLGMKQPSLRDAHISHEQARIAQRTAQILPALGDIVGWEDLGVFALLAKLSPDDVSLKAYPPALLRLAADRNAEALLSTIETYLDLAGDVQATSQALHVHRATLYQRLSRIEAVSGLSLRDGTSRLTLHLGIKLARLTGQYDDLVSIERT
ncbi:PucR family transcriptional regulator [Sinosporangium siamense]|uniref:Transcriptional regulator n=1 Tax=Sinosporangium siamense TaxID=1367973 RepID=A0A919RJV8_9ACTN|nr:helix-turn-helix domain-containing protein [Sinosporangium siamense]GII95167.1 transcriptional regulator [Sinosporangium siamense]